MYHFLPCCNNGSGPGISGLVLSFSKILFFTRKKVRRDETIRLDFKFVYILVKPHRVGKSRWCPHAQYELYISICESFRVHRTTNYNGYQKTIIIIFYERINNIICLFSFSIIFTGAAINFSISLIKSRTYERMCFRLFKYLFRICRIVIIGIVGFEIIDGGFAENFGWNVGGGFLSQHLESLREQRMVDVGAESR